jgi:hypothetical protein
MADLRPRAGARDDDGDGDGEMDGDAGVQGVAAG